MRTKTPFDTNLEAVARVACSEAAPPASASEGVWTRGTDRAFATFSMCGRYRYALGRAWDESRPLFSVVMLNPSTASAEVDDPTIRRCIHFAKQEGCGSLLVRNLFAWRATSPLDLLAVEDPVGPLNVQVLDAYFGESLFRVAAWGALEHRTRLLAAPTLALARSRAKQVLWLTKHGDPRHPLYLPNSTRVRRWDA